MEQLEEEARSADRVFVVTGRSLYEKTDFVRRAEGLPGEKYAGTFSGMGQHTLGSAVEQEAGEAEMAAADLLVSVEEYSKSGGTLWPKLLAEIHRSVSPGWSRS